MNLTTQIREKLNLLQLQSYLDLHLNQGIQSKDPLLIEQFNQGQSNPTFLLNYNGKKLVLRKQPQGQLLKGAHLMDREYFILNELQKVRFPVPKPILLCQDKQILGVEFYIMEFVEGRIFREPYLAASNPKERKILYEEMNKTIAQLHNIDITKTKLNELTSQRKNYFQRQVKTWSNQYRTAQTENIPQMEKLIEWLEQNTPSSINEDTMTHGDIRIDNFIFHPVEPKVVAVVDWELATIGSPWSDIAYNSMCFRLLHSDTGFSGLGQYDPGYSGIPTERNYLIQYLRNRGYEENHISKKDWEYCLVFGIFRYASISQGIYKRFLQGNASSQNAKEYGQYTKILAQQAMKIISNTSSLKLNDIPRLIKFSEKFLKLRQRLIDFMDTNIYPNEQLFLDQISNAKNRWVQPEILKQMRQLAKSQGLWNFFLPSISGLTNVEYGVLAMIMGRSIIFGPEVFNCQFPDTGNMETIHLFGNQQQKDKWLTPLLNGEFKSVFAMTEIALSSSDATNIETTIIQQNDNYIVNGRKYYISGAGNVDAKIIILLGRTPNPNKPKHQQHTMILIPFDTKGITKVRPMKVFEYDDAPFGHWELIFDNVIVPKENIMLEEGRGFEIAQGRLGPGRMHHCMRLIGLAERSLSLMCDRSVKRQTFGKMLASHGKIQYWIAQSRVQLEMAKLLMLETCQAWDELGTKNARREIAMTKIGIPQIVCDVIDRAIQAHGATGVSQDTFLAYAYSFARTIRILDGPDEVHEISLAKMELRNYTHSKL